MKKSIFIIIVLLFFFLLILKACALIPPKGMTYSHHSYDDMLEYAKSIDKNAKVSKKYKDIVDKYDWHWREWGAVINGISCHVASIEDLVSDFTGELPNTYYRMDTDYDFVVLKDYILQRYPDYKLHHKHYHKYLDEFFINIRMSEYHELDDEELDYLIRTALNIRKEYKKIALEKEIIFEVQSPAKGFEYCDDGQTLRYYIDKKDVTYLEDFSKEGIKAFKKEYRKNWDLLESDLPIRD